MAKLNMVQAINLALMQEMEKDPTVVVLGEDVGVNGGVFRVTEGLIEKYGSHRVMDTPLAESAILGTALGMAIAGLKPVAEMQFCGFSYLMFPQLEGNVSRIRTRTRGVWTAPLVVRFPYGGGVRALEHHSEVPESYYVRTPGVKVVVPSGPRNARALLIAAIRDPDPVIFMEPKKLYRAFKEEVPEEEEVMEIGKANIIKEGKDLTLISWGAMTKTAIEALEIAEQKFKISIELIDLLSLSPLDSRTITNSVKKTSRCVIVQEGPRTLGIASEIIARINDEALMYLEAPVQIVGGYDVVTPYFGRENYYLPNPQRVCRYIEKTLNF